MGVPRVFWGMDGNRYSPAHFPFRLGVIQADEPEEKKVIAMSERSGSQELLERRLDVRQLVREIRAYRSGQRLTPFKLNFQSASWDAAALEMFAQVVEASRSRRAPDAAIEINLDLRGFLDVPSDALELLRSCGGRVNLLLPQLAPGAHEQQTYAVLSRAARFLEGPLRNHLVDIQCAVNPGLAPVSFLRELQRIPCSTFEILWPADTSTEPRHGSAEQADSAEQAECEEPSPSAYWYSDLFRLWWLLDIEAPFIPSFRGYLRQWRAGRCPVLADCVPRAFSVDAHGQYGVFTDEGSPPWSNSVASGYHLSTTRLGELERLVASSPALKGDTDQRLVDRYYFEEQTCKFLSRLSRQPKVPTSRKFFTPLPNQAHARLASPRPPAARLRPKEKTRAAAVEHVASSDRPE